ncbi:MAG: sensor histidine kinase [Janthinobacterium lividum]
MDDSELPATHAEANRVVEQIVKSSEASGDASTGNRLADLRNSIDQYWDALPAIRERNGAMPEATQRLRSSPERRQVRRIARQINALNRDQQDRAEAQLNAEQRRLQAELLVSSVLAFVIVLALVAVMSYRIKRAERLAEMQYRSMAQAKTELQNFAARLEQAQEEERRTLSRELHDAFGQTMAAALVELSRIQEAMTHDDGTRAQLASVKLELESSMRSIRDIALVLRPSMLDDLGLVPALRWQGREVARHSGLAVRVEADDASEFLPDTYRTCIYRVVQEALHNTVKHASATSVVVTFQELSEALVLRVEDDGKGFRPDREKGLGLLGIEERVGRLSGLVRVTSLPDKGTSICVTLPKPAAQEREAA